MQNDFYSQIASNKRKTIFLLMVFSVFVIVLAWFIGIGALELDPYSAGILGFIISSTYALIAYFASSKITLMTAGAKEVNKQQAPELYRLVENVSITAGIQTPKVYVIDDDSPNAFATGRDPKHAAVAFTTGLLRRLDKAELEGVIAHEISHIKNYDTRVMTVVVVLVGLVVLLSDLLIRIPMHRARGKEGGGVAAVALIVGVILGLLSPLFAELIKLAVSRTREYLADASSTMLTRNPDAFISALTKIASTDIKLSRANHATAHLYIANPFGPKTGLARLFSTHPPIEDRIARLKQMM